MTADAIVGVKEKCLEVGMNDFLTKPIDPPDLYKSMHKWLQKSKKPEGLESKKPDTGDEVGALEIKIPHVPGLDIQDGLNRVRGNPSLFRNCWKVEILKPGLN